MNLTIDPAQARHWCLYCPDLILENEDAATGPDLKDPIGEQGFAHVDCATANGHAVEGAEQPDPADARYAIRQAVREHRDREPANGTILADDDLGTAYVRDDNAAEAGDWGDARWYLMDGQGASDGPVTWAEVPEWVKDGVRLLVVEGDEREELERYRALHDWLYAEITNWKALPVERIREQLAKVNGTTLQRPVVAEEPEEVQADA